jgi:hypothetical protein
VVAEEFHYSKKGREVLHYKLANKYIVIAPKIEEGVANKLKRLLPAFAVVSAGSLVLQFMTSVTKGGSFASRYASEAVAETGKAAAAIPAQQIPVAAVNYSALFLFVGGVLALTTYFLYDLIRDRIK